MMMMMMMMMILINEGRASRAQASRVIPCTSEPKSRAHTRRFPMCPNLGTAGSQFLGLLGNLLETNLAWEPLPGNPVPNLAPCGFGCSEGFSWKRQPFPGTRFPTLHAVSYMLPVLGTSGSQTFGTDASQSWNHGFPVRRLLDSKDWNPCFSILEPFVPSSRNYRFSNVGTHASQSWNRAFPIQKTAVPKDWNQFFPSFEL